MQNLWNEANELYYAVTNEEVDLATRREVIADKKRYQAKIMSLKEAGQITQREWWKLFYESNGHQ